MSSNQLLCYPTKTSLPDLNACNEMGGEEKAYTRITRHRTLHELLDEQAHLSPADPAVCCADGILTYHELSQQSWLWARFIQTRTFGLAGSVVPIYMPSSSMWAFVAMFAVLRTEAAFAFIDSSLPESSKQLQTLASTVNAPCVVLGPEEYNLSDIRSTTPSAVCLGTFLKPRADLYDITEGTKHLVSLDTDVGHPAWALLESTSDTVTLHQHHAVIDSILRLSRREEVTQDKSEAKFYESQSGLVLWPFIIRHDTLLEIFGTIIQGGLVLTATQNNTPENIRRLLFKYPQPHSCIYIHSDRLLDAFGCDSDIFLYDYEHLEAFFRSGEMRPIYYNHDMGHGRILIISILSDGSWHFTGASSDVSVVYPDNMELQAPPGTIGELIMTDNDALASHIILQAQSSPDQPQHPLPFIGKVFRTGLSACIHPNGSIQIMHKTEKRGSIISNETSQRQTSISRAVQDENDSSHLRPKDTQNSVINRIDLLRRLWADVLGMGQGEIKPNDRFLDLGGDSLKAAQLISLARVKDVELPVLDLFTGNLSLQEMATSTLDTETSPPHDDGCCPDRDMDSGNENSGQGDHDDVQTLLSQIHLPEWIRPSYVEKIVPATGWQAFMAGHMTLEAQHWADCWVVNFYGTLSIDRLQTSCASLLEKHEILRSVFAVANGNVWQIIVGASQYPMEFTLHQVRLDLGETLDSTTHDLWNNTKKALPELDRQWVRFMLIRQTKDHHRLLVRLTHAQYDAGSIPAVLEHLRASYQAGSCAPESLPVSIFPPQFSQFVAWAGRQEYVQAAETFWKTRLNGSKPTYFRTPPRDGPPTGTTGLDHVINERISSPEIVLELKNLRGIMPSTIVSTAWSAVLMFLTNQNDVVCGIITSGRHNAMPGIDQVIGPCWNMLPVRTQTQSAGQTVLNLLQQVQRNQQAALAHELLPFRHIVEKCTTWAPWTNLCSIINFENVQIPRAGGIRQTLSSDVEMDFAPLPGPVSGPTDFWVAVTPYSRPTHTSVTLQLRFDNRRISKDYTQEVMRLFSKLILLFTQDPEMLVTDAISRAAASLDDDADRLRKCIMGSAEAIRAVLDKIWADVLGCDTPVDESSRSLPYYRLRSEVVFAAAIAQNIRRKLNVDISTEVVVRNPSLSMLESWLLHKIKLDL